MINLTNKIIFLTNKDRYNKAKRRLDCMLKRIIILITCLICLCTGFAIGYATNTSDTYKTSENDIEIKTEVLAENVMIATYFMPKNTGFKSYMDYTMITDTTSQQYKLQSSNAITGEYGIRMVNDRYCIALGSFFTSNLTNYIGQYVDLVLENGTIIPCILADQKADIHTDENNIITTHNGCVAEFVVETELLDELTRKAGDISYCNEDWISPVTQVIVYEENIFNQ